MNILEKMFMRFSLEERRKHLCNTLRERGELQALNTDELGFVFMCVLWKQLFIDVGNCLLSLEWVSSS